MQTKRIKRVSISVVWLILGIQPLFAQEKNHSSVPSPPSAISPAAPTDDNTPTIKMLSTGQSVENVTTLPTWKIKKKELGIKPEATRVKRVHPQKDNLEKVKTLKIEPSQRMAPKAKIKTKELPPKDLYLKTPSP